MPSRARARFDRPVGPPVLTHGGQASDLDGRRYREALGHFADRYPATSPTVIARAPGRVTIAGQHNDYNHAHVLSFPIRQDVLVLAAPRMDTRVVLGNMDPSYQPVEFVIDDLRIVARPRHELHWWDYLQAMTAQIVRVASRRGARVSGMNVLVDGRIDRGGLPAGAGLGSSSALLNAFGLACVALARPRFDVTSSQLATAAMYAENSLGFPSGLQDPMGSLGGDLMSSDGCRAVLIESMPRQRDGEPYVVTRTVPFTLPVRLLLVHTGVPKGPGAWKEFNVRAAEAKLSSWLIAQWLSARYPAFFADRGKIVEAYPDIAAPETAGYPPFWRPFYFTADEMRRIGLPVVSGELDELVGKLPVSADQRDIISLGMSEDVFDTLTRGASIAGETMSTRILNLKGSFCHVLTEQARVLRAMAAVERRDIRELGHLQGEVFQSLDFNYRVVSPEAKALVAEVRTLPGVMAARPLGGVWACVVAVWLTEDAQTEILTETIAASFDTRGEVKRSDAFIMPTAPGTGAGLTCL
jgi:galactokinase